MNNSSEQIGQNINIIPNNQAINNSKHFLTETNNRNNMTDVRGVNVISPMESIQGGNMNSAGINNSAGRISKNILNQHTTKNQGTILRSNTSAKASPMRLNNNMKNVNNFQKMPQEPSLQNESFLEKMFNSKQNNLNSGHNTFVNNTEKHHYQTNGLDFVNNMDPKLQKLYHHSVKKVEQSSLLTILKLPIIITILVFVLTHPFGVSLMNKYVPVFNIKENGEVTVPSLMVRALIIGAFIIIFQQFL